MSCDSRHLDSGVGQFGIFLTWCDRITEEKQAAGAFFFPGCEEASSRNEVAFVSVTSSIQ
jgi:hypothetical protein